MVTQSKKLTRARKKCDRAMQLKGRELYPVSIISGQPTQVMHHFWPKSTSAVLRYDWDNLIPLTNGEHMQHHLAGDPSIHGTIIEKKGLAWFGALSERRGEIIRVNLGYYEKKLEELVS